MHQDSDNAKGAAQRERTGVAHEDLRWVTVEPKEAQTGADEGGAKDSEFAGARHKRDLQITGNFCVACDISKNQKDKADNECATDGQAVQTIGQIDGVGAAYDGNDTDDNPQP